MSGMQRYIALIIIDDDPWTEVLLCLEAESLEQATSIAWGECLDLIGVELDTPANRNEYRDTDGNLPPLREA